MINYLLEISTDVVNTDIVLTWQSLLISLISGGVFGAISGGIINHLSNANLWKKNAEHEKIMTALKNENTKEMQQREAECQQIIKNLDLKYQKESQEKEAEFRKDFEALKNEYDKNKRIAEAINTYFSCAGKYFVGLLGGTSVERDFFAAHATILRYLPKNCELIALNIYELASEGKFEDASSALAGLADEIQKHNLPL